MKTRASRRTTPVPKRTGATRPAGRYLLRLFVAGATSRSNEAVRRVRQLCKSEMMGKGILEVIDIYQQPGLARKHQIVATPTLIMEFPRPVQRFIGNLASINPLLVELNVSRNGRIAL